MSTYVISDLHSHLDILKRFIADINPEDRVFCLGDAIDKGPDGIRVLDYIRTSDQITMLLGNHELMMIEFLKARRKYTQSFRSRLGIFSGDYNYLDKKSLWLDWNGGQSTFDDFMSLPVSQQMEIENYLNSLPVLLNLTVGDRDFVLVHAFPANFDGRDIYYLESGDDVNEYVWTREPHFHIEGKTVVTGHTIVQYYFGKNEVETDGQWYDIDLGLAMNSAVSQLAVLCLDDLKVSYYPLYE